MAVYVREIEAKAKEEADRKSREIISNAIQKYAADHVAENTVSVVSLPSDEMKGRIIEEKVATYALWRRLRE
jgi:ribonuclease Y